MRRTRSWCALVVAASTAASMARAENIDPDVDGSRFAYAENAGWINARPLGSGGPGIQVDDFELTGWAWAENLGWINLSCKNLGTCGTVAYGVANDGAGNLSGRAWSENAGWIDFAPLFGGVTIDPATGNFAGEAWSENAGWVTFAASSPVAFKVTTGWRCVPAPSPPIGAPALAVSKSASDSLLTWSSIAGATGADVVRGRLSTLRSSAGDFSASTEACVANDSPAGSVVDTSPVGPGDGLWFLVRGVNCGGSGSFDSGSPDQVGSRDAEVAGSGFNCP